MELCNYLLYGAARKAAVFGEPEFKQLHPALCEGVYLYGGGEAQNSGYLLSRSIFGVDDHCKSKLFFKIRRLGAVFGASYTGYGLAVTCFFGDKAAQQIQLI